jgi:hypothetical protein
VVVKIGVVIGEHASNKRKNKNNETEAYNADEVFNKTNHQNKKHTNL